jgi:hypothetical protein
MHSGAGGCATAVGSTVNNDVNNGGNQLRYKTLHATEVDAFPGHRDGTLSPPGTSAEGACSAILNPLES